MRFTWLGNYYTVIFMSDQHQGVYICEYNVWGHMMQNIWRPSVGKIGKYIFFERLWNLFVKLCTLSVFLGQNWERESSFPQFFLGWVALFCFVSWLGFSIWGHRQEGKVVNSPHWIDLSFIHFNSSHKGRGAQKCPFLASYCTSFNLLGGCEQMGSSLLL